MVPIREMTDVLSVESKSIDLSRDTWVRMKIGTYKRDLAKVGTKVLLTHIIILLIALAKVWTKGQDLFLQVVDVDDVRQRVTVKLIPRVDLQALASKLVNAYFLWFMLSDFSLFINKFSCHSFVS